MRRRHDRRRRPPSPLLNEVRSFSGFMTGRRVAPWICFRSRIEREALAILEFDPAITCIERNDLSDLECAGLQVVRERDNYRVDTPFGRYTPDLRVTSDRVVFVEVGGAFAKAKHREKLLAARAAIEHDGYGFAILTEREVRAGHRARNCTALLAYVVAPLGTEAVRAALETRLVHKATIAATAAWAAARFRITEAAAFGATWTVVAEAAHSGRLVFDLDADVLDAQTPLALTAGPREEVQLPASA